MDTTFRLSYPLHRSSTTQLQELNTVIAQHLAEASTPEIEDFITEDGILSTILSSLTLAEAVRTSVLSPRWRHLWTHLTKFTFDAISVHNAGTALKNKPLDGEEAYDTTKGKAGKFIQIVNSVLQQLPTARLDMFQINYFLDQTHSAHLDAWVQFAVAAKTKSLKLHLFRNYWNPQIQPYAFPWHVLGSSPSIEALNLMFCSIKLPCKLKCLSRLKRLVLADVDVSEEDFNYIVASCASTLVNLWVWKVSWESMSIPHPLSQLETLLVELCVNLRKIDINAVNLIKLQYHGVPADFRFRQSPKLNEAHICFETGGTVRNLNFYLSKLWSSLPHLKFLTLKITGLFKVTDLPKGSSKFNHLTRLEWECDVDDETSLVNLRTLLDVAPSLKELKLKFQTCEEEPPPQKLSKVKAMRAAKKLKAMLAKHPYTNLKRIELIGFYFHMWQIEIGVYLLINASELESMTIERSSKLSGFTMEEINEMGMKYLKRYAPENVNLVII